MGNEAAAHAAKMAQTTAHHLLMPFVAANTNRLVRETGKSSTSTLWHLTTTLACMRWSHSLHSDLFLFFPDKGEQSFITCALAFHLLGTTFFKIKQIPFPDCPSCGTDDAATHLILDCALYACERAVLQKDLQNLDSRTFFISKVLGSWSTPKKTCAATRTLVKFLVSSGQASKL